MNDYESVAEKLLKDLAEVHVGRPIAIEGVPLGSASKSNVPMKGIDARVMVAEFYFPDDKIVTITSPPLNFNGPAASLTVEQHYAMLYLADQIIAQEPVSIISTQAGFNFIEGEYGKNKSELLWVETPTGAIDLSASVRTMYERYHSSLESK